MAISVVAVLYKKSSQNRGYKSGLLYFGPQSRKEKGNCNIESDRSPQPAFFLFKLQMTSKIAECKVQKRTFDLHIYLIKASNLPICNCCVKLFVGVEIVVVVTLLERPSYWVQKTFQIRYFGKILSNNSQIRSLSKFQSYF